MSGHSYTPPKTVAYERLVRECYLKAKQPKLTGSLKVMLLVYCPIPKSTPKKTAALMRDGKIRHVKRPDVDNIAKSVLDALNGVAFDDDSAVYSLFVAKRYEDDKGPRVMVRIREEA